MSNKNKKNRIFVGLSGGVDSAVTAALLKKEGHDVTGVFIKGWYPKGMPCTWASDRQDAMRVAAKLHIPFVTLDASKEYKTSVIDYIIDEYRAGRTPNPDIMCNRDVKFGAFFSFAKKHGANFVATGHYAITKDGNLYRGVDEGKDQSYFLWAVPQNVLKHVLFPLGKYQKEYVRTLAKQFHLPVATKRDSQGICFLGSISVEEFLTTELGAKNGSAKSTEGVVVGTHKGAVFYTIGERVPLLGAVPGPWYVHSKDVSINTLVVSKTPHAPKEHSDIKLSHVNFFQEHVGGEYEAQYRYHGVKISGMYNHASHTFLPHKTLGEPLAKGQSLVLYTKDICVGGGIIVLK